MAGATLLLADGALPLAAAWGAVLRGIDVYLFLLGMMLLAELLRTQGVFERLAARALSSARGSQWRLFALVFGVAVLVTIFFSNDATAVVLTPAVATMAGRTRISPYPYLFACAFVANAASFVLPISNPANLVLFGSGLPRLLPWLEWFLLPSLAAVVLTFSVLALGHRTRLRQGSPAPAPSATPHVSPGERVAAFACGVAALGLVVASLAGLPLGATTLILSLAAFGAVVLAERSALGTVPRGINYAIVPLVAGLFVIVEAMDRAGAAGFARSLIAHARTLPLPLGNLELGAVIAIACNLLNNLPVALSAASVFAGGTPQALRHAALVAVDLGPNVAVSGSLATLLWMDALRRSDIPMNAPRFLRSGIVVAVPALVAALLVVR